VKYAQAMREYFTEALVPYDPAERERWGAAAGDARRLLIPDCCVLHPDGVQMILNQPGYRHFAETAAIRHFHAVNGYRGHRFYVLSYLRDFLTPRFVEGGREIQRRLPRDKLQAFVSARSGMRGDSGEPDVFLFGDDGTALFVEVKGPGDSLHRDGRQLQALSQIRQILGCRAEVVRLYRCDRIAPKAETYWVEPAARGILPVEHGTLRSTPKEV
jgi:hypothetical protein